MNHRFLLSTRGRVAAVISFSLVCAPQLWAAGIEGAPGSAMTVTQAASGAEVVQIARPEANGLSHNLANSYNIGVAGAVINNAVNAGVSQLAGRLEANAQLGGQAASVVLAEVVSRNPSLLLGQQEMFGHAADFVLANPNGISCNGCGFINTPRASLLVGTAQQEDGRIRSLQSAGGAALSIGSSGVRAGEVLDLIAPRIDDQGAVVAVSGINALSGHAVFDYASGQSAPLPAGAAALDSRYLGGMEAGRIRIVSTDLGAGVNLGGALLAAQELNVRSQGTVALQDAQLKAPQLTLAGQQVSAQPLLDNSSESQGKHDESWFLWQTGADDRQHTSKQSEIRRSSLEGQQLSVEAAGAIALEATDVKAGSIRMQAGEITLNGALLHTQELQDDSAWLNSWSREQHKSQETQQEIGSSLVALQDISLSSRGDIDLQGAQIKAGHDLHLSAGQDLRLAGLVEQDAQRDQGRRYLEGAQLESGSWDSASVQQRLQATQLQAGALLDLSAAGRIGLQGARLQTAGDMTLNAAGSVEIGTQTLQQTQTSKQQSTRWGGLAGSDSKDDSRIQQVNQASDLQARGAVSIQAGQNVKISGSMVHGDHGARALAQKGSIEIDPSTDSTRLRRDEHSNGVFNIPLQAEQQQSDLEHLQGTRLDSGGTLQLAGSGDIAVLGSHLNAATALELQAGGKLTLGAAQQHEQESSSGRTLQINAGAGLDSATARAHAELGATQNSSASARQSTGNQGSSLSGNSVALNAGGDLTLQASQVTALAGDAAIHGKNLTLGALYDQEQRSQSTDVSSGGVQLQAGLQGASSGLALSGKHEQSSVDSRQAQPSKITASGRVQLDASGQMLSEGASVGAGGALTLNATQIDNQAAVSRREETQGQNLWSASQGQTVDLSGWSKPVIKVLDDVKNGQFSQARDDAGKLVNAARDEVNKLRQGDYQGAWNQIKQLGIPQLGSEISLQDSRQNSSQLAQGASGSQFSGASVQVHSAGVLNDQATLYQAGTGELRISADSQHFSALDLENRQQSQSLQGGLKLNASTNTGKDLTLKVALNGADNSQNQVEHVAQTGGMLAGKGIDIALAHDADYQGTRMDAGQGALKLVSGGTLSLGAALTGQEQHQSALAGTLAVDLTLSPNPNKAMDLGGGGKLSVSGGQSGLMRQGGEVAQLDAGAGVLLQAGKDLRLVGSQINSPRAGESGVLLRAAGNIEVSAVAQIQGQDKRSGSAELAGESRLKSVPGGQLALQMQVDQSAHAGSALAHIAGAQVSLESGRDLQVNGGEIQADKLNVKVGGDLRLSSLRDEDRSLQLALSLAGNSPNLQKLVSADGVDVTGKLKLEQGALDAAVHPSGFSAKNALELAVAGQGTLTGASIESAGTLAQQGGGLALVAMPGSRSSSKGGVDFSGTPLGVASQVARDVLSGKPPLGLQHESHSEDLTLPARQGQR